MMAITLEFFQLIQRKSYEKHPYPLRITFPKENSP